MTPLYKLLIASLLVVNSLFAQQAKIDSLNQLLTTSTNKDANYAKNLQQLAAAYAQINPEIAIKYGKQSIALCKAIHEQNVIFDAYVTTLNACLPLGEFDSLMSISEDGLAMATLYKSNIHKVKFLGYGGFAHNRMGNFTGALQKYQAAIKIHKDDPSLVKIEHKLWYNLASLYNVYAQQDKALECVLKSLKMAEMQNDDNIINMATSLIGAIHISLDEFESAEKYITKSIALAEKSGNINSIGTALHRKGAMFQRWSKTDSAIYYFEQALPLLVKTNDVDFANVCKVGLAAGYTDKGKYKQAFELLIQAEAHSKKTSNNQRLAHVQIQLARLISLATAADLQMTDITPEQRYALANEKMLGALQIGLEIDDVGIKHDAYQGLSRLAESNLNFKDAYLYYKKLTELNDSMYSDDAKLNLDRTINKYAFSKKEDSLRHIQAITDANLQNQSFLNQQQQQELELNRQVILAGKQNIEILSKDKQLEHLASLKTKAEMQILEEAKKLKERQIQQIKSEKSIALSNIKILQQQNENSILRRKQLIAYGLAGIALLVLGLSAFNTRKQNKQILIRDLLIKDKAEQALLIAEQKNVEIQLQKDISELSLVALRSQMNPHFIFNSLNSINSVIIDNNIPLASDYLTKFSKLIRLILDNSAHSLITLNKEIETLKLYLLMEGIRFKDKFDYSFDIDENLDIDKIKIPPTTLQPFVENAIVHGLMHLQTKGHLQVSIKKLKQDRIEISISDNGVGRSKAAEYKSQTNKNVSHGFEITKQRILQLHTDNSIEIRDKVTNDLQAAGTTILITLHI